MSTESRFNALASQLERRFDEGVGSPWTDQDFNALALAAFAHQFESIAPYRGFCAGRGRTPASVTRWQDVPAVPASAFKHVDFIASGTPPEAVFRTSGTTRGHTERGRHAVARLSLYRHALLPSFRAHLVGGERRVPFLSLIPDSSERPDSSLSFMVGVAAESFATEVEWLVDRSGVLDEAGLRSAMSRAAGAGDPVLLLGTALALLHAIERLEQSPAARLPPGSRVMETGGLKGVGREIPRADLHARLEAVTGVPPDMMVSEYGMTELLSQLYEPVLSEGHDGRGTHVPPPWLRVRALDPVTLDDMPRGDAGLLAFFDLANAGSICHVLTEDIGSVVDGRVRLEGRAEGAEPRGCSLAMDELMSASRVASPARRSAS